MFRLLGRNDRESLRRFLNPVCIENIFLHWNLAGHAEGLAGPHYWGDSGPFGLQCIAMRHSGRWMVYHRGGADWDALAALMLADGQGFFVSGPGHLVSPLLDRLSSDRPRADEVMPLLTLSALPPDSRDTGQARRCSLGDLDALDDLYGVHSAVSCDRREIARILSSRRVFAVWDGGQIASAAFTLAESDGVAVIGGVFTRPEYRGRGYAAAAVQALSQSLLGEGRVPWLYSGGETATRLYARLGFELRGTWIWSFFGARATPDAWGG